ncbi:MAG: hypothetical protein P8H33_00840 [Crocinitomicaceae bacterium]|nr:hypothetical protein [Crocinitomicaceae bacterium]MDG1775914.1 hypothetical protein [Crocinitomicaceae bacterium]
MKHILHKNVNGKKGTDGRTYFQVYVTFTVDRISYRLKSQLITRPITKEEFDNLTAIYEGKISDILDKEREILFHSMDENTKGDVFNRNQFREDYVSLSRNLIDIMREVRNTSAISDWSIPAISWELTKNLDIENDLLEKAHKNKYKDQDLFELEVNLQEFQLAMRKNGAIQGLCLLFDWEEGSLKQDVSSFLKRQHNPVRSNELIDLLDQIIKNI